MGPGYSSKRDQRAIDKRRRELLDEKQTIDARKVEQFQNELNRQRSQQFYQGFNQRMDAAPPSRPIQYRDTLSQSRVMDGPQLDAIAPGEDDPARLPKQIANTTPRGADLSKPAAPEGPSPAIGMGAGGPENPTITPEQVRAEIARRKAAAAPATAPQGITADQVKAEIARRKSRAELDAGINELADQIPGGYQAFKDAPPDAQRMAELGYVQDPLAKSGFAKPREPDETIQDTLRNAKNNPPTRNLFTDAVRFLEAPVAGLTGGGLEGWAKTTSEDPLLGANEAVEFVSPVDDFARASYGFGEGVSGVATGDMDRAAEGFQQFATEGSYTAMQALPGSMTLKGITAPARAAPTTLAQAEKAAVAASRAPAIVKPKGGGPELAAARESAPTPRPDETKPFSAPPEPSGPGVVRRNLDRIVGGGVGAVVGGAGDAYAADGDGNGGGPLNATTGAAIGIFGPRALASAGSRGYRAAARAARSPGARAAFDERVAARAVRKGLVSGGLKTEQEALAAARARFGDKPAAVADLTQDSVGTATSLSRLPGATGEAARARGEDLLQTQPGRVFGDIAGTTGIDPASVTQSIDDAIRAASEEISPAYEALFDANKGVNSERLMQLADDPIVGPYVRRAIQASESLQTTAGQTASNARIWDLVKRGLDRTIESQKRTGGQAAYELEKARAAIKDELDSLMPGYKAVRDGADAPRMRDARKKGAQVMSGAVSVESVKKLASSLTGRPLTAMQAGMIEKIVPGIEKGKNIQALASGRTKSVLEAAFGPDVAEQLVSRIRSDVAIVDNARRINPNVGSVTSQANMGGGDGAMAAAANVFRAVRSPVETALAAMSKSGSYTKAQRDLMGEMLLEGPSPENLARIYRGKTRNGAPTRTPPAPNTGLGSSTRELPGQTSKASPAVTGALVGGGLGYVASDGDPTATVAGAIGGGGLGAFAGSKLGGNKLARGPKPPAANGVGGSRLPMDQASMKARGTAMGFDMETPLYSGRSRPIESLEDRPIYLTPSHDRASRYAMHGKKFKGGNLQTVQQVIDNPDAIDEGGIVYKVFIRNAKPYDMASGQLKLRANNLDGLGYSPADIKRLKREGYTSVIDSASGDDQVLLLSRKNIFDPADSSSARGPKPPGGPKAPPRAPVAAPADWAKSSKAPPASPSAVKPPVSAPTNNNVQGLRPTIDGGNTVNLGKIEGIEFTGAVYSDPVSGISLHPNYPDKTWMDLGDALSAANKPKQQLPKGFGVVEGGKAPKWSDDYTQISDAAAPEMDRAIFQRFRDIMRTNPDAPRFVLEIRDGVTSRETIKNLRHIARSTDRVYVEFPNDSVVIMSRDYYNANRQGFAHAPKIFYDTPGLPAPNPPPSTVKPPGAPKPPGRPN